MLNSSAVLSSAIVYNILRGVSVFIESHRQEYIKILGEGMSIHETTIFFSPRD